MIPACSLGTHSGKSLISLDLFELDGNDFIVLTDYYSKFFEIMKLPSTTSSTVIKYLKPQFARYGIPEEVISDNGPQFSSNEFAEFARTYKFRHTTFSPKNPQSNGQAKRTVQTAKGILKKAKYDKKDPNLALLDWRNAPGRRQFVTSTNPNGSPDQNSVANHA